MDLLGIVLILSLTIIGFLFQMLPFMRKFNKYGKPSMSLKEKKDIALDRKYKQTFGESETKEINNLYEDTFFVLVGFFLEFMTLIFSLITG